MKAILVKKLYDGLRNAPIERAIVVFNETGIQDILHPGEHEKVSQYGVEPENQPDLVMIPGMVDAHVHLMLRGAGEFPDDPLSCHSTGEVQIQAYKNAITALHAGVTTLRDAGAAQRIAVNVRDYFLNSHEIGPDIVACGEPLTRTGGHCHFMGGEADGPDEIRKFIRLQQKNRSDYIKLIATSGNSFGVAKGNTYSKEEMTAAVVEAHHVGMKITMHASMFDGLKMAVYSGTDGIEHCQFVEDGQVKSDKKLAEEICKRNILPCHTLSVYTSMYEALQNKPKEQWNEFEKSNYEFEKINLELRPAQLAFQLEQGVPTVGGSDAGWRYTSYKTGMALNCEMYGLAGMNANEIIHSSTHLSAKALGLAERLGSIKSGMQADMVLLREDPENNLLPFKSAFRSVERVYKCGRLVFDDAAQLKYHH